jgi:hypothetical protein
MDRKKDKTAMSKFRNFPGELPKSVIKECIGPESETCEYFVDEDNAKRPMKEDEFEKMMAEIEEGANS